MYEAKQDCISVGYSIMPDRLSFSNGFFQKVKSLSSLPPPSDIISESKIDLVVKKRKDSLPYISLELQF